MFIKPQQKVYAGMIVGENSKQGDLEINVLRGKQLTNVRASGTDEAVRLIPPRELTLEDMITYVGDDELVEVTPKSLRLRKKFLDGNDRRGAGQGDRKGHGEVRGVKGPEGHQTRIRRSMNTDAGRVAIKFRAKKAHIERSVVR